jgi:hypothetical protein
MQERTHTVCFKVTHLVKYDDLSPLSVVHINNSVRRSRISSIAYKIHIFYFHSFSPPVALCDSPTFLFCIPGILHMVNLTFFVRGT